jgi:uncharacterized protein
VPQAAQRPGVEPRRAAIAYHETTRPEKNRSPTTGGESGWLLGVGSNAWLGLTLAKYVHLCRLACVGFEWDEEKAEANKRKHGVDFADAATVLGDEMALTIPEEAPDEEDRFVTVGSDALGRVLVVVYAWRGDEIRLISARKATRAEREQYEGTRR